MSALTLIDLHKSYNGTATLKGIDLALEEGEFLVLLGPSGCGKSTILNIIAGLLEPTSGDIRIAGRSVIGVHPKDRDIAMVFQSYALYPNLTVARNIGFGLEMRGVPKADREAAVARVAETLQITPLLGRRPGQLSGGQRQRVAIGRALVRDPAIFLFDEPLSNLDAKLRLETRAEIKRLHQSLGKTMIYVTHDQIEAMTLATRIAVLRDGKIEQLGDPAEVYRNPANLFVAQFMGSNPMNIVPVRLAGEGAWFPGAKEPIALSGLPRSVATSSPESLLLGFRPESVRAHKIAGQGRIPCAVDLIEFTGPEKLVTFNAGGTRIQASLDLDCDLVPLETCFLEILPSDLLWFDASTGTRL